LDTNVLMIVVVALLVTFGMPVCIVLMVLTYRMRKAQLTHDTMLKLAEKGVPIPPELLATPMAALPPGGAASDLKVGIVLLAAGAGISLFFLEMNGPVSLGAVPALMGIGYLVAWRVEKSPQSGP
jgi:hypothetical protein